MANHNTKSGSAGDHNVAVFPNQAAIKQQAGAWLVRIDQRKLTAAEAEELKTWAQRSDFHYDYLVKLAKNWDAMEVLEELAELFPLPTREQERATAGGDKQPGSSLLAHIVRVLRLPTMATAAATVCALVLVWFVSTDLLKEGGGPKSFRTAVGEQLTQELEDGTTLTLNTNSVVNVDYSGIRRVITHIRGEVNFDVAKDPARPFIVYAGSGMVWAVGTAFNVRLGTETVDVTVTEGRVKVFTDIPADAPLPSLSTAPGTREAESTQKTLPREAELSAGETLQYSQTIDAVEPIVKEKLEQKLAWQKGSLIFKGETLEQALVEISRYTDKELIIVDPAIRGTRVGGHYKMADINSLLHAIGDGFNIEVTEVNKNLVHLSAK